MAAGAYHTVGLRSDGTVEAVGYNGFGQCNVYGWYLGSYESNAFPWIIFYPAFIKKSKPQKYDVDHFSSITWL